MNEQVWAVAVTVANEVQVFNRRMTSKELQSAVGGSLEYNPIAEQFGYYDNEAGRTLRLPENRNVTLGLERGSPVWGNVVFTRTNDDGDTIPLTRRDIRYIQSTLVTPNPSDRLRRTLFDLDFDAAALKFVPTSGKGAKQFVDDDFTVRLCTVDDSRRVMYDLTDPSTGTIYFHIDQTGTLGHGIIVNQDVTAYVYVTQNDSEQPPEVQLQYPSPSMFEQLSVLDRVRILEQVQSFIESV